MGLFFVMLPLKNQHYSIVFSCIPDLFGSDDLDNV